MKKQHLRTSRHEAKERTRLQLSRREREIMEIVYRLGRASVSDVVAQMGDKPSYDTVRVTLGILTSKGHLSHYTEGRRYIYRPTVPRERASRSALRNLLQTFFSGSPSRAIMAMLDMPAGRLSEKELDEIEALIKKRRS